MSMPAMMGDVNWAQQCPHASPERHAVHLPVALDEVDAERGDDAPCHGFQRAEPEDAEQHPRHIEHGREYPATNRLRVSPAAWKMLPEEERMICTPTESVSMRNTGTDGSHC